MIRVLVVDDSRVARELVSHILQKDPELEVVGAVSDGGSVLSAMDKLKPDIVTMDINMPQMDGFAATRQIMEERPLPIVIVSGTCDTEEVAIKFKALEAGALAVIPRPGGLDHPSYEDDAKRLVQTVKIMSEVKVVRRWSSHRRPRKEAGERTVDKKLSTSKIELIAVGASTGGPSALKALLSNLDPRLPVPIVIVQHMAPGFLPGFVEWLSEVTKWRIEVLQDKQRLAPGQVYFAGDDGHTVVLPDGTISLTTEPAEQGVRPAVSQLFRSVKEVYGARSLGILLTGMGKDGAVELKELRDVGATTVVQSVDSCVVAGMPSSALALDAADFSMTPEEMGPFVEKLIPVDKKGAERTR